MCIALSARFFFRPDIVEQIWLSVTSEGQLHVEEVYDVFFQTPDVTEDELKQSSMLLLSPHGLRNSALGILAVEADPDPGDKTAKKPHDAVYPEGAYEFKRATQEYHLELVVNTADSGFGTLGGKVLRPLAQLPTAILGDNPTVAGQVMEIMESCGTLCELLLGNLQPKTAYAMRLIITPQKLNVANAPANVLDQDRQETSRWQHELDVISPSLLTDNYEPKLAEQAAKNTMAVSHIRGFRAGVDERGRPWLTPSVYRHRVYLLYPPTTSVVPIGQHGSIFYVQPHLVPVNAPEHVTVYRGRQWAAGVNANALDDPYELAFAILRYMQSYSGDPKKKEDVTSALNGRHSNVSCVVDALKEKELLVQTTRDAYSATALVKDYLDGPEVRKKVELCVTSDGIIEGFYPTGFKLTYIFFYSHESASLRRRRRCRKAKQAFTFWATVAGTLAWLVLIAALLARWFSLPGGGK